MAKRGTGSGREPETSSLRIIGGKWRSRVIRFAAHAELRPTGDRVRETLFNWLAPQMSGANCIDLFAGSGALGFEALSRGAAYCRFVESHAKAARQLNTNAIALGATGFDIEHNDVMTLLRNGTQKRFDIVFIDPPFHLQLTSEVCELLDTCGWLCENAVIYCETSRDDNSLSTPPGWQLRRDKVFGDVRGRLYCRV